MDLTPGPETTAERIDDLNLPGIKTHGWTLGGRVEALTAAIEAAREGINLGRSVSGEGKHTSTGSEVERCSCPDIDVTAAGEMPGSRTVKGRIDPDCPVHKLAGWERDLLDRQWHEQQAGSEVER